MDAEVLARLDAETATVRAELGRSETKAGHLLTIGVAVHPVVGGQAAEVIACLPLPGGRSDYKLTG